MKVSARNSIKGIVKKITVGAVNAEISIEISAGVEITAIITKSSAEALELQEGSAAYAVIKASDVMLATD